MPQIERMYRKPRLTKYYSPPTDSLFGMDRYASDAALQFSTQSPRCHLVIFDYNLHTLYGRFVFPSPHLQTMTITNNLGKGFLIGQSNGQDKGGIIHVDTESGFAEVANGQVITRRLSNGVVINIQGT